MNRYDRRTFLKTTALATGAGLAARFTPSAWAQPSGANEDIRLGVIGFNQKGAGHIRNLLDTPGARIVALCDVDPNVLAREVENLKAKNVRVFATTDARELLARSDVDAVVIATSTHWHALLTVWACQAGKDVYVEKPVSRTVWEGRAMIQAAAKYGRLVQAGTQFRSDTGLPEAIAWLREGRLGRIQFVLAQCYRLRGAIGLRQPWYPEGLDYDLYCGSTPMAPLRRDRLHYDWHWVWRTGNGDLGNIGIHALDIARRFIGHETPPRRVLSLGGRYVHADAAISFRLGEPAGLDRVQKALEGFAQAGDTLDRMRQHLGVHGVDVNRQNLTLGRWIALDDTADDIVGVEGGDDSHLERARYLLNEAQRPPFAIPQEII